MGNQNQVRPFRSNNITIKVRLLLQGKEVDVKFKRNSTDLRLQITLGDTIGIQSSYAKYASGEKATWTNFIIHLSTNPHLSPLPSTILGGALT